MKRPHLEYLVKTNHNVGLFAGHRLGVDIGGTTMSAAVVDGKGKVCGYSERLTGDHNIPDVLQNVEIVVHNALRCAGISLEGIHSAGIGLPGEVDLKKGELRSSPILSNWQHVPVVSQLKDRLGIVFSIDNDANAALIGESYFGAARDVDAVLMMTIGTGIGGALMINGNIWRGKNGSAGEIGHLCVDEGGPECWCGQRGCLGVVASTTALINYFEQRYTGTLPSSIDGKYIADRFRDGDPVANDAIVMVSKFIARAIEMSACVVAPDRVVLHGGMVNGLAKPLLSEIHKYLAKRNYPAVISSIEVVEAELGLYAGAVGAALIPETI